RRSLGEGGRHGKKCVERAVMPLKAVEQGCRALKVVGQDCRARGCLVAMLWTMVVCAQAEPPPQTPGDAPLHVASVLAEARKLIDGGQPRAAGEKLQPIGERGNP